MVVESSVTNGGSTFSFWNLIPCKLSEIQAGGNEVEIIWKVAHRIYKM